ncbi:AlpA family transcriptional regulator [Vibrio fluvialis]|nr:AlpA family transcriptional regulator [Vibrio fluvialis]
MRTTDIGERPMRFLKLKEVMEKTALSRSAIYRKMSDGEFPQSVSLGDRAVAWVESEVDGGVFSFKVIQCRFVFRGSRHTLSFFWHSLSPYAIRLYIIVR